MNLISHIERFLGEVECGWRHSRDGAELPFDVVKLVGPPEHQEVTAYVTVGLSANELKSSVSGKVIRQELFFMHEAYKGELSIPDLLQRVAMSAVRRGEALLRGEVIRIGGFFKENPELSGLYVSLPVLNDEKFGIFNGGEGYKVVFSWLFPIYSAEIEFIERNGWSAFEELLDDSDINLLALPNREAVIK